MISARRRLAALLAVLAVLGPCVGGGVVPRALAEDATPRERFWRDGDAKALATSLGNAAGDDRERADAALARLAAAPGARPGGDGAPPARGYATLPWVGGAPR